MSVCALQLGHLLGASATVTLPGLYFHTHTYMVVPASTHSNIVAAIMSEKMTEYMIASFDFSVIVAATILL